MVIWTYDKSSHGWRKKNGVLFAQIIRLSFMCGVWILPPVHCITNDPQTHRRRCAAVYEQLFIVYKKWMTYCIMRTCFCLLLCNTLGGVCSAKYKHVFWSFCFSSTHLSLRTMHIYNRQLAIRISFSFLQIREIEWRKNSRIFIKAIAKNCQLTLVNLFSYF